MAKMCGSCSYYDADGDLHVCPECGAELQFTMLGPPNAQLNEEDESAAPAWERPEASQTELLELPLAVRLSQITTGIIFYFLVWRYGAKALTFCFKDMLMHEDATVALVTAGVIAVEARCVRTPSANETIDNRSRLDSRRAIAATVSGPAARRPQARQAGRGGPGARLEGRGRPPSRRRLAARLRRLGA